jgi:hypothetical protein
MPIGVSEGMLNYVFELPEAQGLRWWDEVESLAATGLAETWGDDGARFVRLSAMGLAALAAMRATAGRRAPSRRRS